MFTIHPKVVTKKIEKKSAKQFFQKHTNCEMKKWEKIVGKIAKKRFLYSHDNHHQKWGEVRAKQFFQKQTNCASKKLLGKKSSEKSSKQRFLYLHEYCEKKWGGKTRETIFTEEHE